MSHTVQTAARAPVHLESMHAICHIADCLHICSLALFEAAGQVLEHRIATLVTSLWPPPRTAMSTAPETPLALQDLNIRKFQHM